MLDGELPRDPTFLSYSLAATCLLTLQERQALLEASGAAGPAGDAAARDARGDARDAGDPVAARHRGGPHHLVAQLTGRMARRSRDGGTPATVALTAAGVDHQVHTYEHDPGAASYGLEAAVALDVDPGRVFKTLLVLAWTAGSWSAWCRCRDSST